MDKADIRIFKINEAQVRIETTPIIHNELKDFFSARPLNYRFMPAYKTGAWNGYIYYFSNGKLPIGLVSSLLTFAKGGGYSVFKNYTDGIQIDFEDFKKFVEILELPFKPYDFQIQAAYDAITKQKLCIEAPTSSGKSLIIYIITRFLQQDNKKLLIIVPQTNLVEQIFGDFIDYGFNDIYDNVHRIYSGKDKTFDKPVIISTWQSVYKDKKIFKNFDGILVDECHGAKSKSIMDIAKKSINAQWRIGLSGTYPNEKSSDWFSVVGSLGLVKSYISYKKLTKRKIISELVIKNLFLKYPLHLIKENFDKNERNYHQEIDFLNSIDSKVNFISKLANKIKNNTLILFIKIEYGKRIFETIQKISKKRVFYIDGTVSVDIRENYRKILESKDGLILVASYGTYSQGVNIKNIHNIILANSYKSKIKILQSIGRGLRKKEGKDKLTVFDLIDNLIYEYIFEGKNKKYINYCIRHYLERKKMYESSGFNKPENIKIALS